MTTKIVRVTMFKIAEMEIQQGLIAQYKALALKQQRNGKPYILSLHAGIPMDNPRTQGYTVVAKTEFASLDDMMYYDNECPAHQELKKFVNQCGISTPTTVFFEPQAMIS